MATIIFEDVLQELFTDLHESNLFEDGKDISDAVLKDKPETILSLYRQQKATEGFDFLAFFNTHFEKAPQRDSNYKSDTSLPVETHINKLWNVLTRQAQQSSHYSSLIDLPYPYIVPGGRFNEIYYWDSYFTMLGLQVSRKIDMIESMIKNFSWLIDQYGFIPNGNRSYFLGRSQPPFYALMIDLLASEKGDETYIDYLPTLEKEYQFWMEGSDQILNHQNKAIKRVVSYEDSKLLNRYFDNINRPRTEMYTDDVELLEKLGKNGEKMILDIKAACESGWDFSSRWFREPDKLETIHTTDILPVDLNCLLYHLEKTLYKANHLAGNTDRSNRFQDFAKNRKQQINECFWNETTSFYHDYDFVTGEHKEALSLAGIFPLFFRMANEEQASHCARFLETRFLKAGGLISTTFTSGQQWDAPNGWAPLQWIAIQGLRNYGFDDLAATIKERWVTLNKKIYKRNGKLLEKYNVVDIDLETGGGEYPVQDGFGWTNGVLLKLLSE